MSKKKKRKSCPKKKEGQRFFWETIHGGGSDGRSYNDVCMSGLLWERGDTRLGLPNFGTMRRATIAIVAFSVILITAGGVAAVLSI